MEAKWNLKFKMCLLLGNIWKFCKKYSVEAEQKHKLWMNDGFDFCYDYEKELTPTRSLRTQNNYSTDSLKRQFEYLESLMEMSDSEEFEDEITRTYSTGGLRDVAVPLQIILLTLLQMKNHKQRNKSVM